MLMLALALAFAEEEAPKWDVNAPPGPSETVAIDVDEGTWMSVTVSPDGQTVVFDLLGDLYSVPIGGGEATSLTSGMAWDFQPVFSPDGTKIAFTSDRAGGDNLWIMEVASGEFTQVTTESFRLLNGPAWHPSGEYLVGRKHFTAGRSLGSGEMWLYPLSGGPGMQLTKKPNEQQDVNEPSFSPDGRYLYYSQDTTPGPRFQYNKDPNGGIYTIFRLDLESGDRLRVAGGAGGASRPTPSPDGKSLAYLRRHRAQTWLVIKDIASGAETVVWDGMSRDQQESWAIHGTYPALSWTPDSSGIVAWAEGKLWNVPLDGEPSQIAFHVEDSREIRTAVRHNVDVSPDEFTVRAIRGSRVSPDGTKVVFEALGKLWVRAIPNGEPRRLTKDENVLELDPSWSPDGREIVYATWNDETLGEIRRVKARGGKGKAIMKAPGHYRRPTLAADGTLAWERLAGGYLRDARWSNDTGVWVRQPGEEAERITGGHHPQLVNGELYVQRGWEPITLQRVDLHTRKEHQVASSEMGVNIVVSPEGDQLLFQEHYNAYLVDLPRTGASLSLSPDMKAVKATKVSKDAGNDPQFAAGHVWWTLGPELTAFHIAENEPTTYEMGLTATADKAEGLAAIKGARIITMQGDTVLESGTIVWDGDRIVAVGPADQTAVPEGAKVMDGARLTVIPGLIDVHAHGAQGEDGIVPQENWVAQAHLAFGVTTVHDPSNDTMTVFTASERQRAGTLVAPRIFSTGTILYGAHGAGYTAKINSLEDAMSHLRRLKAVGAFSVKSYNQPRREQRQQVLEAARQLEMMVVPEGGSTFMHNINQIVDGHTGIEHAIPIAPLYRDVIDLWAGTQVGYTPTLGVAYGGMMGENYWYAHTHVWEDKLLNQYVPWWAMDPVARRATILPDEEYYHVDVASAAHDLFLAGVSVQEGAHGQREGLASHWEMWMMEQGGFTPHEALRAATYQGAWYLGLDGDLGSLQEGKLADMVVLRQNPLENLRSSTDIAWVVQGGRILGDGLQELWPEETEAASFWWESGMEGVERAPSCTCEKQAH